MNNVDKVMRCVFTVGATIKDNLAVELVKLGNQHELSQQQIEKFIATCNATVDSIVSNSYRSVKLTVEAVENSYKS